MVYAHFGAYGRFCYFDHSGLHDAVARFWGKISAASDGLSKNNE